MNYAKAQMSSFSEEGTLAGCPQPSPAGVKLEAVMDQLKREQEEKHLLQAQLLFTQQAAAVAAAARASGSRADGVIFQAAQQHLSRMDLKVEDSDQGVEEMLEPEEGGDDVDDDEEEGDEHGPPFQAKKLDVQQVSRFQPFGTSLPACEPESPQMKQEEKSLSSPAGPTTFTSPNGFADWSYDELFRQRGGAGAGGGIWAEENEGGKAKGEPSRDFAKLYELDSDPQRKEFLDELFVFMQKRGTPVNRIPIMAKQVLDLYRLYKLVTEKGGLVEVINKKIWREITKGLNLPTSITSAAFTLRTQYMKYLYPFECDKKGLSSPGELQAAIDSNRREGRRPSYTTSLYRYSPSPGSAPHGLLSSPPMQAAPIMHNGLNTSASPNLKRHTDEPSTPIMPRLPVALALGQHHHQHPQQHHHQHHHQHPQQHPQQQHQQLAQAATLEHLRERLDRAAGGAAGGAAVDGPERKMMRFAEEQQRFMQQALQQNLLAMASHFNPVNLKLNNGHEKKQDLSLSISTNGPASISVSVEVNGTVYSGTLVAQKPAAPVSSQTVTPAGTSGFSALSSSSSHSPSPTSSTSSKGPN
ncbi:AT-rich interactive domain-containing protein 3B [Austrofundulus limnaeus]|uniref:AT-rich interactive domain-containing protein 3 n=1 Tax=Austrofundulus limnaeus TaxID=52670 RepID=A0A2I4CAG7_AUSLI|nr:PREDICTED: AT-rich interactive domain-containing protein 3B-like [Austrofundulus limnaeus]